MTSAVPDVIARMRAKDPENRYLAYHAPRYELLLGLLSQYVHPGKRVLDIGASVLTEMIAEKFALSVDTLGFAPDGEGSVGRHYRVDLNDAQYADRWRTDIGPYDVIVMAEVIEHIYTAPSLVLAFIRTLMADDGILIVQTPNAVALHKRLEMLVGRNPYNLIVEDNTNPLHFREYTNAELLNYIRAAGLEVVESIAGQYFDYRYAKTRARFPQLVGGVNLAYRFLPSSLKPGQTVVCRKPKSPAPVSP